MESNNYVALSSHSSEEVKQPIVLTAQLMKNVVGMQHVDELFSWLASAMSHYWDIPIVQFWALQTYSTGQIQTEMRAGGSISPALPQQVYSNREIAAVIKRLLYEHYEQQSTITWPIKNMFSAEQTYMLAQYNLHYWAGCFLRQDLFLPPMKSGTITGKTVTSLNIGVSLFLQQPPSPRLLRAVNFSIMQGLRIAESRNLIIPTNSSTSNAEEKTSAKIIKESAREIFNELIPGRIEEVEKNHANNPLGKGIIIEEKNARRLYTAIDGQRTIKEIAQKTNLNKQEIHKALRDLLQQKRIQLYKAGGEAMVSETLLLYLATENAK